MDLDLTVFNEAKETSLITDPRFEAGLMSRESGDYEAAIDFFAELLKTYESSTPLHAAPLYFNYGSTLVCGIEKQELHEEEEEIAPSETVSTESRKRGLDTDIDEKNKTLKTGDASAGGGAAEEDSAAAEEEEEEEEEEDDDDDKVAWQCLDMARELYQKALTSSDISKSLEKRLKQDLARTTSRIGDLNMLQCKYGDALIEYELCIKLRGEDKDNSVDNVCRLVDANMQVAFAYLEHVASHGEVGVEALAQDGSTILVAKKEECIPQCMAYRDQAKSLMENLIDRLAREKVTCSNKV